MKIKLRKALNENPLLNNVFTTNFNLKEPKFNHIKPAKSARDSISKDNDDKHIFKQYKSNNVKSSSKIKYKRNPNKGISPSISRNVSKHHNT